VIRENHELVVLELSRKELQGVNNSKLLLLVCRVFHLDGAEFQRVKSTRWNRSEFSLSNP